MIQSPVVTQPFQNTRWPIGDNAIQYGVEGQYNNNPGNYSTLPVLLSNQREWRKAIGHDLPKFNGTPENWPEFLSRYQRST